MPSALRLDGIPIPSSAVGEKYRRLAAKTLCVAYRETARDYLWPLQIGVAQPLGTEAGLQVARQRCARHYNDPGKVFVKLDFANAFNTVNRQLFLKQVRDYLPGLAPWVDYCYAEPSKLVFVLISSVPRVACNRGTH